MKQQPFEEILNDCLDRLAQGEPAEACLARHPQVADLLRPLLQIAWSARQAAASVQPRPEARAAILRRVMQAQAQRAGRRRPGLGPLPWLRPWAVATATLLLLVLAGGGTAAASAQAVPGEPLYPVKLARERVTLAFVPSSEARARYHLRLAQARGEEMEAALRRGKGAAVVEGLAGRLERHTEWALQLAGFQGAYPPGPTGAPGAAPQISKERAPLRIIEAPAAPAALPAPVPPPAPQQGLSRPESRAVLPATEPRPAPGAEPGPGLTPPLWAWRGRERARHELRERLHAELRVHRLRSQRLLQQAPPQAQPGLQRAFQRSQRQLEAALAALEASQPRTPRPFDRLRHPEGRGNSR